jgi:enoyl-CoA hydratase/carnithine racemase
MTVHHERRRGFDVLTLDSPHNRNALSLASMEELRTRAEESAADDDSRGLVLDHEGDVFCSGIDLRERHRHRGDPAAHSRLFARLLLTLWNYPKPLLCRVAGASRGGGMGLVTCADVVVASPTATFAYSEVRVGVAPALVSALALRKVPLGMLLPLLVTGEVFDADRAARLGLVSTVREDAPLAETLAAVAAGGPAAIRTTKQLARRVAGATDVAALVAEMEDVSAALFAGAEAAEGMAAFAERRPPAWSLT